MEKRIFVAVLLSFAILYLYGVIAPKLFPSLAPRKPPVTATATTDTTSSATTSSSTSTTTTAAPAPLAPAATPSITTPVANVSASAQQFTRVETPDFIAVFSNRGAEMTSFQLKRYRAKSGGNVELVKARPAERTDYPFSIVAANRAVADQLNGALWAVNESHEGPN